MSVRLTRMRFYTRAPYVLILYIYVHIDQEMVRG